MANASLVVRVSAQIAEFQKSFNDASKTAKEFASDFEGIATRAAAVGSFFGNIAADIAKSMASGFAGAIKDAVKFSTEFNNAFTGLSTVARAFGTNTDAATRAARALSADGLIPVQQSAKSLQNLLSVGFGLPEAIRLLNVAKDSAAFNRQGFLSMGEAVERFTQGIKFNNSQLTDSTGLGKNLSKVMQDAGLSMDAAGRAAQDAGVRQAILDGFLKEGAAFTGDAARAAQTYSGQLAGMKNSWITLLATWGDAITKNKTVADGLAAVRDLFNRFNTVLSDNHRAYNLVSDAIISFVKVLAGTVRAINFVQTSFNSLDTIIAGATRGILTSLKSVADFLLKIIVVAAKIPGSGIALSAFGNEISGLALISGGAGAEIKTLGDRIADNDRRTKVWGATLTGAADTLDTLAGTLSETRGKTVELGESTDKLGNAMGGPDGLAKKTTVAEKALAKFLETGLKLRELQPGDLLANVSIPIPPPVLPSGPGVKIGGIDMGDFWHLAKPTPPPLSFWAKVFPPKDVGTALGNAISNAIQGGGNILQAAVGSLGQSFTTGFAKFLTTAKDLGGKGISGFLGGAINAVLPGVGALLGPLVGKIGSALKNAFGLGSAGRDLVKDFAASFGGFDALHKKLGELGAAGEALWIKLTQGVGKNSPEQAKAAIEAINAAFGNQADQLSKTQAVLDEYGITFDQTGEKFRNQTIANAFDTLFEKTKILQDAGVDYGLILEKQSSQYSELTAKAIASNTEIPSSMRPLLEKMSELGLLTDAATGEFIDLSKVKWAQTLTEGFKSVVDSLDRIGDTLDKLAQRQIRIPITFDVDELPDNPNIPRLAGGGIVRRPTLAVIGEAGPEAVVPLTRVGMGLSSDGGGDVYVSIGNKAIDPYLVNVTRRDAARGGLVTSRTTGRRY